jgi:hypothetical protein
MTENIEKRGWKRHSLAWHSLFSFICWCARPSEPLRGKTFPSHFLFFYNIYYWTGPKERKSKGK